MHYNVTKRNGNTEQFDPHKIKKIINWACQGLDVEPIDLESKFDVFMYDNISTDRIHDNIIYHANSMCTPEVPDWAFVAGRLYTFKIRKSCYFKDNLTRHIEMMKTLGYYAPHFFENLTQSLTERLNEDLQVGLKYDFDHSYASVLTFDTKYRMPHETPSIMHMVNAIIIGLQDKRSNDYTEDDIYKSIREIFYALCTRKISLATPWLSNLRKGGSISSCFTIEIDDSIESIFDNLRNMAFISKNGGGIGVSLARVRAKGSPVQDKEDASNGITGWCKLINDTAISVDQLGARKGAITVNVPVWHKDIELFLDIQSEHGDQRTKCHDIFPQVGIFDLFMERIKNNKGWYCFCPYEAQQMGYPLADKYNQEFSDNYTALEKLAEEGKIDYKYYTAKELLKLAMASQFETGLPYLAFMDTINRDNPSKNIGNIGLINLCNESFSVTKPDDMIHCCNLASIVAGRMNTLEDVRYYSSLCAKILDIGIELTKAPIPEAVKHNNMQRTIGVGVQGLHDWLAKNNKSYMDRDIISSFFENLELGSVSQSIRRAKEIEPYPYYVGSEWNNKLVVYEQQSEDHKMDWNMLRKDYNTYGIRNSITTSPAPNTSTSTFMDATPGVMPTPASFYVKQDDNGTFPQFGMYIKNNPLNYSRTHPTYDQAELAKTVSYMQKWVDTGISTEYYFDLNKVEKPPKALFDLIVTAWECGNKANYYIRTIKKNESIDSIIGGEEVCVGCSG